MRASGGIEFVMSLEPLHKNPDALKSCVGAVVNVNNNHWVALRRVASQVWLLDSQEPLPQRLTEAEYKQYVKKHRGAFPIRHAENMSSSSAKA